MNYHHPKKRYQSILIFVFVVVAVFTASMVLTNFRDKQGNIDLSQSNIFTKVKQESQPVTEIVTYGKGQTDEGVLYQDNDDLDVTSQPEEVVDAPELQDTVEGPVEDTTDVTEVTSPTDTEPVVKSQPEDSSAAAKPDIEKKPESKDPSTKSKYKEGSVITFNEYGVSYQKKDDGKWHLTTGKVQKGEEVLDDDTMTAVINNYGGTISQYTPNNKEKVEGVIGVDEEGTPVYSDDTVGPLSPGSGSYYSDVKGKTYLYSADTDQDGMTDADEIIAGTDPKTADTDSDGLTDAVEMSLLTDPNLVDSDSDGVSDAVEYNQHTNPLNINDAPDQKNPVESPKGPGIVEKVSDKVEAGVDTAKKVVDTLVEYAPVINNLNKLGTLKGYELYRDGGYKYVSNGDGTWTIMYPPQEGKPPESGSLTSNQMISFLTSKNCENKDCIYDKEGTTIFGGKIKDDRLKKTLAKAKAISPAKTSASDVKSPKEQPSFTASYSGFDPSGDLVIEIKQDDKPAAQYYYRDGGIFKEYIFKIDPETKDKKLCTTCKVVEENGKFYLIDSSIKEKSQSKFLIGKGDVDPDDEQDRIMESFEGKYDDPIKNPACANAGVLLKNKYNALDFEFRTRVETVFGTLFEKWTEGWLGSKMEMALYSGICGLNYYRTEDSEVDLIAGQSVSMPAFEMTPESKEIRELFVVEVGGEKEELSPTMYRYAISLKLIGQMHYVVYLYNSCTGEKSYYTELDSSSSSAASKKFSWKDYFEGTSSAYSASSTSSTKLYGWKDEGLTKKAKSVHQAHYAGDEMTFDCEKNPDNACRFDTACVKILNDIDGVDNSEYEAPYCVKLVNGRGFLTLGETGSIEC